MDFKDFNAVVDKRIKTCVDILVPKGEEYSRDGERLHNFKKAALVLGVSPARALLGMYSKHLVSVLDIVDDLDAGKMPKEAVLSEKMTDSINYHLLLEALIIERMDAQVEFDSVMKEGM